MATFANADINIFVAHKGEIHPSKLQVIRDKGRPTPTLRYFRVIKTTILARASSGPPISLTHSYHLAGISTSIMYAPKMIKFR
jgi:hypothetical protein